ncbi:MAG: threonylcarbamoyl-AMP synthase [Planctomycetes bacterium]|nr:threonylcarbamoyl-AMP synthase [Planctomycetota bacterium]
MLLREPAQWLRDGRLVALPTETVYGLGANALDETAVRSIFAAKQRPAFNPLIVHVADPSWLGRVVADVPPLARRLIDAFWPGPLTLVLPRRPEVPDVVTGGLDTVGVRMPAHPVALALLRAADVPVAAPSANPFTRISPTTAQHVLDGLGGRVFAVVDAGPCAVGIESTVVAVEADPRGGERVVLLREGGTTREQLQAVVGEVFVADHADEVGDAARRSPGRVERHYAPSVPLRSIARRADGALQVPNELERPFALLCRGDAGGVTDAAHVDVLPADPAGFARELYAALHRLDRAGVAVALVEQLPDDAAWAAVRDRLRRAGLR